jgi:tRNA-splicing ligase RtcB
MVPIKTWTTGVEMEPEAYAQLQNVARLPIVGPHVAVMPDCHFGIGATVGSVVPTIRAIIPAAVGVDIGCGMIAAPTDLQAEDLPTSLTRVRELIERAVPVGFESSADAGHLKGGWIEGSSGSVRAEKRFGPLDGEWQWLRAAYPDLVRDKNPTLQLGTLGGGNHFIEVCLDEASRVWIMLHSGSRGIGNRIGTYFIARAKETMGEEGHFLPDRDLAYLREGTPLFADYVRAMSWAQAYAADNRAMMLTAVQRALERGLKRTIAMGAGLVNCHHNYVQREHHFGQDVWLTRKGAVSAGLGERGIIPGSMGARSYIVEGLGNPESFHSCSHGAGRRMSRGQAKRTITLEAHIAATAGVECRKDVDVLDESPAAYKSIDAVMAAQTDLVRIVHTLKQVLCIKG